MDFEYNRAIVAQVILYNLKQAFEDIESYRQDCVCGPRAQHCLEGCTFAKSIDEMNLWEK